MSSFVLVEIADDGSVQATKLTDPVVVTQTVTIPLASLFPQAAPPAADAPTEITPAASRGFHVETASRVVRPGGRHGPLNRRPDSVAGR